MGVDDVFRGTVEFAKKSALVCGAVGLAAVGIGLLTGGPTGALAAASFWVPQCAVAFGLVQPIRAAARMGGALAESMGIDLVRTRGDRMASFYFKTIGYVSEAILGGMFLAGAAGVLGLVGMHMGITAMLAMPVLLVSGALTTIELKKEAQMRGEPDLMYQPMQVVVDGVTYERAPTHAPAVARVERPQGIFKSKAKPHISRRENSDDGHGLRVKTMAAAA